MNRRLTICVLVAMAGIASWRYFPGQYGQTIYFPFSPELVWNKSDAYVVMPMVMVKYGPSLSAHEQYSVWKKAAYVYREEDSQLVLQFTLVIHIYADGKSRIAFAPEALYGIEEFEGTMYIGGPCENHDHLGPCWKFVNDHISKIDCALAEQIEAKTGIRSENRARTGYKSADIDVNRSESGNGPTFELNGNAYTISWETIGQSMIINLHSKNSSRSLIRIPTIRRHWPATIARESKSGIDSAPSLELFKTDGEKSSK